MSKHTAGRWSISDEDRWSYEGFEIIASDGSCVAKTDGWGEEFSGEEEANARLISAAPELLEALIEVTASLAWNAHGECRAVHEGPIMPSAMAIETARAAIAKACGN